MTPSKHAGFDASHAMRRTLLTAIVFLLVPLLTACGKKGPVRPHLDAPATPPTEVTLLQQGNLFVLGWTIPDSNLAGSGVHELRGFRIKRLVYDAADGCPTCREPQDEVAELDLNYPAPGQRIGTRLYWRDLDIGAGRGYRYAITALAPGGQEGPAATIHLAAQQPPPAPSQLQVEAGDARVTVQWQAPQLPDGMLLVGYNLYRRQARLPFPIVPVNAEPLQETRLVDRGLDNGRAYEYRVSALVRRGDLLLESMPGRGALITPQEGR